MNNKEIDGLFAKEQEYLSKLDKIMEQTIKKEELIVNNLPEPA
jgi:hypothetical protein